MVKAHARTVGLTRNARAGIAALVVVAAVLPAQRSAEPPDVPDAAVLRPEFVLKKGRTGAGTAFVVRLPAKKKNLVVLTAWHLFGPAGGFPEQIEAAKLSQQVRYALLSDPFAKSKKAKPVKTGAVLRIPEAGDMEDQKAAAGDIAAFVATKSMKSMALPLAESNPRAGETLWLLAEVVGGAPRGQKLHRATCAGVEDGFLIFQYANAKLELRATSGAAILNAKGEVVGVNYGGGEDEGKLYGYANPVERFAPYLFKAAGGRKPAAKKGAPTSRPGRRQ